MNPHHSLRFVLVILAIGLSCTSLLAQETEYQKWLKKEQERLNQFKEERDKEFAAFLKLEWKEVKAYSGFVRDEKPEPDKIPSYENKILNQPVAKSSPAHLQRPPEEKNNIDVAPRAESKTKSEQGSGRVTLQAPFVNSIVEFQVDQAVLPRLDRITKEGISDFWEVLSRAHYEPVLDEAAAYRNKMKLNDWGYVLLVHSVADKLSDGSRNESILFTWFLLLKSGYDARIGFKADRVFLLLPTANMLYHVPYFSFKDKNTERLYYAVSLKESEEQLVGSLFSYDGKYRDADRLVDFAVPETPKIKDLSESKTLHFDYGGKAYDLPIRYSRDAVQFFLWYPQTNFEVYFSASPSAQATQSLFNGFRTILQDRTELEAVNILLRFCQTAFRYATDQQQFGREKPFFPDETLFYDASNCKHRAVLFAYLVRSLLGLEVVGLDYPGHISTAVKFSTDLPGDSVVVKDRKYIICDPTYINADAGVCMPQFKDVKPNIIDFAARK